MPPNLHFDSYGVPILTRENIESRASSLLRQYAPVCLASPRLTPISEIIKGVINDYDARFFLDADLGYSPEGHKYLGKCLLNTREIFIDRSVEISSQTFNFTVSHEIGHLVLHSGLVIREMLDSDSEIKDTNRHIVLHQSQGRSGAREWLEWQANKFASSLLLPEATIKSALVRVQSEIGIVRNFGVVYLDHQNSNKRDYNEILSRLRIIYNVSRTVINIRLRDLGLVKDSWQQSNVKPTVNDLLDQIIKNRFQK